MRASIRAVRLACWGMAKTLLSSIVRDSASQGNLPRLWRVLAPRTMGLTLSTVPHSVFSSDIADHVCPLCTIYGTCTIEGTRTHGMTEDATPQKIPLIFSGPERGPSRCGSG